MSCPFINICKTCYADNYIMRGSIYRRDMSLCDYQKIVFVVLFKYEYARIMKVKNPTTKLEERNLEIDAIVENAHSVLLRVISIYKE